MRASGHGKMKYGSRAFFLEGAMNFVKYLKLGWRRVIDFLCGHRDELGQAVVSTALSAPARVWKRLFPKWSKPQPRIVREVRDVANLLSDAASIFLAAAG